MDIEDKNEFLIDLKTLWDEAKKTGDEWLLGFVESAEFFVKQELPLSKEVIEIIKNKAYSFSRLRRTIIKMATGFSP